MSDDITFTDSPTVAELIAGIASSGAASENPNDTEELYQKKFTKTSVAGQEAYAHLGGIIDHYELKKQWSFVLKYLLIGMIIAQWLLLAFVGCKWWDFTDYDWLLPTLLVQNLAQIVSLAFIVVQSLFKDIKK